MSKNVLYLSKSELLLVYPQKGGEIISKKLSWTSDDVLNVFKELLEIDNHWTILLTPEISYFKKIQRTADDSPIDRITLAAELPKLFPETLVDGQWDWKKTQDDFIFLEAVSSSAWQWLELGKKNGLIWDKITTAKYIAEAFKIELLDTQKIVEAVLSSADPTSGQDEKVLNIAKKKPKYISFFILIFVILVVTLAFLLVRKNLSDQALAETLRKTQLEQENVAPSPTPEPIVIIIPKPSDFSLRLENASGIAGYASKSATIFKEAGFAKIEAANAKARSVKTIIRSKSELPIEIKNTLIDLLPKKELIYQTDLLENDAVDLVIVLGR